MMGKSLRGDRIMCILILSMYNILKDWIMKDFDSCACGNLIVYSINITLRINSEYNSSVFPTNAKFVVEIQKLLNNLF